MRAAVTSWKWLTASFIGLAIVLVSCTTSFDTGNPPGGSNTGSSGVGGGFSGDPVSPGGTGGTGGSVVVVDDVDIPGEETRSFFTAFQVDPPAEDSAGPKFVVADDIDQDGLLDLVSAWNQSQPIQLHLQRRDGDDNISFRTVTIAGTYPTAVMAGVDVGQIDDDGWLDIVVLVKAAGGQTYCPPDTTPCATDQDCNPECDTDPNCTINVACGNIVPGICDSFQDPSPLTLLEGEMLVYFSPGDVALIPDGDRWSEMQFVNPFVGDPWIHNHFPGKEEKGFDESKNKPEWSGFTKLVVADMDNDGLDDILTALNPAQCDELGQDPPTNTIDLWMNPGAGLSRVPTLWGAPAPAGQSGNVPISVLTAAAQVKDVAVSDVDGDGDLDVIGTFTNAITNNISWRRNPFIAHVAGGPSGRFEMLRGGSDGWRLYPLGWEGRERPIGQVDTDADIVAVGDIDGDSFDDVLVRSTNGQIVQWFRRPNALTVPPEFPPNDPVPDRFNFPWPVFTLTEFENQEPEAIAIGDITGDGLNEVMVAVEGSVLWYDGTQGTVFDPWAPNTIIQDATGDDNGTLAGGGSTTTPPPGSGVGVTQVDTSTYVNALLVIDLDGDGKNDVVGTLDRRSGAGLSDDRLVWYRNTKTDDAP